MCAAQHNNFGSISTIWATNGRMFRKTIIVFAIGDTSVDSIPIHKLHKVISI